MSTLTNIAVALWETLAGTASGAAGRPATPPARADDPAYLPAAFPGILARTMGDWWPYGAREAQSEADRDQEEIDRLRACAKMWRETPASASRLGVLCITDEQIDAEMERRRRDAVAARDARRRAREVGGG